MHETIDRVRAALALPGEGSSDFDLNRSIKLPADRVLRPAGVLCAIDMTDGPPSVWLTKRSSALKHHPGQIAFPGGKVDDADDGVIGAALREAEEEIGLPRNQVEVLGTMPAHETVTGFSAVPVVACVSGAFVPRPEPGEVAEAFLVPLSHLADAANYSVQGRRWRGMRREYFAVPWGPYYIWGATARMLRGLADRMERV